MTQPRRKGDDGGAGDRPQDPLVERLRPDPAQPPTPVLVLEGLLGDSDRAGFRRLYLTRQLDYYAEVRVEDVVDIATIEPDQPPFLGEQASRVSIRRDAPVEYTRTQTARPLDEFDLDVRLGPGPGLPPIGTFDTCRPICELPTREPTCRPILCGDITWGGRTCITCDTCWPTRCETCATCETCHRTCDTCPTRCDTCLTCKSCGIACTRVPPCPTVTDTCATCDTCGIACTRITCQPTRCDPCITRGQLCEQTLAC